jgi:hypothetical protein
VGKSASPKPEGKDFDSPDPKIVGPGSADPRTALFASLDPKGTGPVPSDPMKGVSALTDRFYANRPSSKGRTRARGHTIPNHSGHDPYASARCRTVMGLA